MQPRRVLHLRRVARTNARRNTCSAPGSDTRRAAIAPPVNVSTIATFPDAPLARIDNAFQRLVVLGEDEIAEPLAYLGFHRRELAAYIVLVEPRTVSFVSS